MTVRVLCWLGLCLLATAGRAAEFDRRWFVDGQLGYVGAGSFDTSSGSVAHVAIGRALYPRLRAALEGQVLDMDVNSVAGTYRRDGVGLRLEYDIVRAASWSAGLVGVAAYRRLDIQDRREYGWVSQIGPTLTFVLFNRLHWVTDLRFETDFVNGDEGPPADNAYAYTANTGLRLLFGTWPRPPDDRDHDNVPTAEDQCPDTPRNVAVDVYGCAVDSDADGIPDHQDQCPLSPSSALVDERGCALDSDQDGIPDIEDLCPDTPPTRIVDDHGCGPDHDHDGVEDALDECPDSPPMASVDERGCAPPANR